MSWLPKRSLERTPYALWVEALERSPLAGLLVRASRFAGVEHGARLDGVRDLTLEDVTVLPAHPMEEKP